MATGDDGVKRVVGFLLAATAVLACPCHVVLLLPVVLGLLGGTALGVALETNTGIITAAATVYFVVALGVGLYLLNRQMRDEEGSAAAPPPGRETGTPFPPPRKQQCIYHGKREQENDRSLETEASCRRLGRSPPSGGSE